MRIAMKTLAAGPNGVLVEGKEYDLEDGFAASLVEGGYAEEVKAAPVESEQEPKSLVEELEDMTKAEIVEFAEDAYDLELNVKDKKDDLVLAVLAAEEEANKALAPDDPQDPADPQDFETKTGDEGGDEGGATRKSAAERKSETE